MVNTTMEEVKCPCCDNPWARATGDFFAKLCETCNTTEEEKGLSKANMDFDTKASENFYLYANGGWMKNNPIPKEYPSWNTFVSLHVKSQEDLKTLLTEFSSKSSSEMSAEEQKVAAYYAAALDEDAIEQASLEPMKPLLDKCAAIVDAYKNKDIANYAKGFGELDACFCVSAFFSGIGVTPDRKDSSWSIGDLGQGGLGLPDRDYYFDEDKEEKRVAYKTHVARMLTLLKDPTKVDAEPTEEATLVASKIYDLELRLAEAHMTKTENRDPEATYNKMTVEELTNRCNGTFDFTSYFEGSTSRSIKDLGEINVRNTAALKRATFEMSTIDVETLLHYLHWRAVKSCASYLPKAFVMESFNFYQKTLQGTEELKPRWKRAMAFTEEALGEALGKLYCAKYFDESCKARALTIVENVRKALEERLKEVDWMTESTREAALKKMAAFNVKIGYPDKWIDYSTLEIDANDPFLSMVFKERAFHHQRTIKEINAKTDRVKWFMTPQTVNAYYHPSLNEIVFPAAILQPPFFNQDADDAVNYGAMGAVVGHEMTHGFDDKGRKFNADGNMVDWWTDDDAKEYEKRVQVMVDQANDFIVHDQAVQGKLTSGENIADLGGLNLAFRALKAQGGLDPSKSVGGLSPVQRFFLSWAQCWRQNITKERALQLITLDPHGPNEMRVNSPLSNISAFHEAFHVPEGSPMYKPVESRVDIW